MKKSQLRKLIKEEIKQLIGNNGSSFNITNRLPKFEEIRNITRNILKENFDDVKSNDTLILQFVNEQITENEFKNKLNEELNLLNEGFGDMVKKVVDWIMGKLKSLFQLALKAGSKVLSAIKSILSVIRKFKEKYPLLFKIIVILLVTLIIVVVTAATASAASTGTEPTVVLDMAIGLLEHLSMGGDSMDIMHIREAQTYIHELKSGTLDISQYSEQGLKVAQASITSVKELAKDSDNWETLRGLADQGAKLVESSFRYIKIEYTGGSETTMQVAQSWK